MRRRMLSRSQPYAQAMVIGLALGGLVSAVIVGLLVGTPAMLSRRAEIAGRAEAAGTGGWPGSLPPISWDLVDDAPTDAAQKAALREDIASMEPAGDGMLSWPVLPYPIEGVDADITDSGVLKDEGVPAGEELAYAHLMRLVRHVYSDEPALSVYTDGQCATANASVSKYRLEGEQPSTAEENRREYDAVVDRVSELAAEADALAGDSDWSYARAAYSLVCSLSTYADGEGDTRHHNDVYGALMEGETQCYGVSCAIKALLDQRGIPSFLASGSVGGDPERRHAWVVVWMDTPAGCWFAMDGTCAQGAATPDDLMGIGPYWSGCLVPIDEFVQSFNMEMDKECWDLMAEYERSLAAIGKGPGKATISGTGIVYRDGVAILMSDEDRLASGVADAMR